METKSTQSETTTEKKELYQPIKITQEQRDKLTEMLKYYAPEFDLGFVYIKWNDIKEDCLYTNHSTEKRELYCHWYEFMTNGFLPLIKKGKPLDNGVQSIINGIVKAAMEYKKENGIDSLYQVYKEMITN